MAIISKYTTEQIEQMLKEVVSVLDQHKAPTDLALMVLGNATTALLNSRVAPSQRESLAKSFSQALVNSVDTSDLQ